MLRAPKNQEISGFLFLLLAALIPSVAAKLIYISAPARDMGTLPSSSTLTQCSLFMW